MKVSQFLQHHGISENPFGQEDAQSDHVFRAHCLSGTHHPAWDKIFGNPASPSTSIVFGEKGAGKTALRLQIVEGLAAWNLEHPSERVFTIEYDNFNSFLDCFQERVSGRDRRGGRVLTRWQLWDHMDAILSLGVTRLVSSVLHPGSGQTGTAPGITAKAARELNPLQKRDLLLLAAFYDHTFDQPRYQRWTLLRKTLRYSAWKSWWPLVVGLVVTVGVVVAAWKFGLEGDWWPWLLGLGLLAGWVPAAWKWLRLQWTAWRVMGQIRIFDHLPGVLRRVLSRFDKQNLDGQPVPAAERSDDRYELLAKLQSLLDSLGYTSIVVLVDRVDEPHLVNGSPERMRDLLWPMFDNKLLKHPGMGFKLLLPLDVVYYLDRESKAFFDRSRLDKQNLIRSLEWTGESLYDVATDRLRACGTEGESPALSTLFSDDITQQELIGIFSRLRVPRHLFKFLYRLLVEHCNRHTDENPSWKISRETLHSTVAVFSRELEAFDRGMSAG